MPNDSIQIVSRAAWKKNEIVQSNNESQTVLSTLTWLRFGNLSNLIKVKWSHLKKEEEDELSFNTISCDEVLESSIVNSCHKPFSMCVELENPGKDWVDVDFFGIQWEHTVHHHDLWPHVTRVPSSFAYSSLFLPTNVCLYVRSETIYILLVDYQYFAWLLERALIRKNDHVSLSRRLVLLVQWNPRRCKAFSVVFKILN